MSDRATDWLGLLIVLLVLTVPWIWPRLRGRGDGGGATTGGKGGGDSDGGDGGGD